MADASSGHEEAPPDEDSVGPPDFAGLTEAMRQLGSVKDEASGLACLSRLRECLASVTAISDEALWEAAFDGLVAGSIAAVPSEAAPLYAALKKLTIKLHANKLKKTVRDVDASLTKAAMDIARMALATPERVDEYLAIAAELQAVARRLCRGSGHRVALYGSVATGLASATSDLDCVFVGSGARASMTADDVRDEARERGGKSRRRGVFAAPPPMKNLERELTKGSPTAFRVVEAIGFARIPILRLVHTPTKTDIDLSFNSVVGVHNSRLLHSYVCFDMLNRVAPLVTLVKRWAKARRINDSSRDTLSSFAYTLMVVFFLQQRGVLPNLQAPGLLRAYERWRGAPMPAVTVHGFKLRYCADEEFLGKLAEFRLESRRFSTESIGSLLLGFFTYYASVFDWEQHAVSVRLGRPRPRKGWEAGVRGRMGIEDPFENERDLCATLGKNGRLRGQERIFSELGRARDILMRGMSGGAGELGAVLEELLGK
ncbi:hypothetical protein FNF28_06355 [Cafeteria roenbergensis]|uniref:PAP-associated domain-containing protein n=1 Tax=Cafeteria roenbergensis TaxID=33653 RepID=A0A5A8CZG3_CAFRO|nr:hypothetical protein FNF28_06355 [Cafeteria roenbergensis]